jgi:hypothetical protein
MLIQCLVYFGVFAILTGVGLGAFYLCWEQTRALTLATDDIGAALQVGERWRADVRGATGKISVAASAAGERMQIPGRNGTIVYRFEGNTVRRELPATPGSQLVLSHVKTSAMVPDVRDGVSAWRWELDLVMQRPETQLPLLFTFEAAQNHP